jgi:hypothetical protein
MREDSIPLAEEEEDDWMVTRYTRLASAEKTTLRRRKPAPNSRFSGGRPSPAAATAPTAVAHDQFEPLRVPNLAVPGDGHTPAAYGVTARKNRAVEFESPAVYKNTPLPPELVVVTFVQVTRFVEAWMR